jgi:hypothetical protein
MKKLLLILVLFQFYQCYEGSSGPILRVEKIDKVNKTNNKVEQEVYFVFTENFKIDSFSVGPDGWNSYWKFYCYPSLKVKNGDRLRYGQEIANCSIYAPDKYERLKPLIKGQRYVILWDGGSIITDGQMDFIY